MESFNRQKIIEAYKILYTEDEKSLDRTMYGFGKEKEAEQGAALAVAHKKLKEVFQLTEEEIWNKKEYITHEEGDPEAWKCICGNTPSADGFYSCDENGNEVEPTEEDWKTNNYVCAGCGRIIDVDTLEIKGQNKNFKLL